jgi:4-alpha-glucanotransferase
MDNCLSQRRAGVLLHPTSLPEGNLGADAFRFVDFLANSGFSVWQVLPLGPVHQDLSPYQSLSAQAGNDRLICPHKLASWLGIERGELSLSAFLEVAAQHFFNHPEPIKTAEYQWFVQQHARWLEDYVLFRALRTEYANQSWTQWPLDLRQRDCRALDAARLRLHDTLQELRFSQFVFFVQWHELKQYANSKGIQMFGDMPFFVSHDSSDVWAFQQGFRLDEHGEPTVVAGVPPDYFSATGQRWGNPHYHWQNMAEHDFLWWVERIHGQFLLYDALRIDHFRGFESCWTIPSHEPTAINGYWEQAPGEDLFAAFRSQLGELALVAEDLGVITPEVEALRRRYGLPGMKILQFAFDSDAKNPYLPHHHRPDSIVYTGTHDNNTTLGWYEETDERVHRRLDAYCGCQVVMPDSLIKMALASTSRWAIVPLQDLLRLDGVHRMNVPGTVEDNWRWAFQWEQFPDGLSEHCRQWLADYDRLVD